MNAGAGEVSALPFQRMLLERLPQTRLIMMAPQHRRARAAIDLGALRDALELLVALRASLRTAVFARDGRWLQRETNEGPRVVPIRAERGLLTEILPSWREAVGALDAERGVNLVACPIETERGCHGFGLVVSHMAMDGVASRDLERLVGSTYDKLVSGQPPVVFRESAPALAYAARLVEARAAGLFDGERAHWAQTVRAARASRGLGGEPRADLHKRARVTTLDEATWTRVRSAAAAAGMAPMDAVWAILIHALQSTRDLDGLLIHVFAHGRRDPRFADFARTWGALALTLPVFVPRLPAVADDAVRAFGAEMTRTRAIAGDGLGYWMLRELDDALSFVDPIEPGRNGVSLNWLGSEPPAREPFRLHYLSPIELGSTQDRGPLALAVNEQAGGLRFLWEHLPEVIDGAELDVVWARLLATCEELA